MSDTVLDTQKRPGFTSNTLRESMHVCMAEMSMSRNMATDLNRKLRNPSGFASFHTIGFRLSTSSVSLKFRARCATHATTDAAATT